MARLDYARTLHSGLFWSGALSFVTIGIAAALYGPSLPVFSREFGVTPAQAGLLVSVHSAGGMLALLASAGLGAVTARQSLALICLGAGLIAAGIGWWATLAGGTLLGAGYALVSAVFNRRFLTETGAHGPAMVGVLNAMFGVGAIAGPLMFVLLGASPAAAFGVVCLVAAVLIPFAGGGSPAPAVPAGGPSFMRQPAVLGLGAMAIGLEVSLVGLGPSALVSRGITETGAAQLASAFFACFLAARFSLVWLAHRVAPLLLLAAAFGTVGGLGLAATVLPPAAFYVVAGAAIGLMFPCYFVAASAVLGNGARAAAAILAAGYAGAIAVPAAISALVAQADAAVLFPAVGLLGLASAAATLALARRRVPGAAA